MWLKSILKVIFSKLVTTVLVSFILEISEKFEGAYLNHCHIDKNEDKGGLCVDLSTSSWTQFFTLLRRMLLQIRRNTVSSH